MNNSNGNIERIAKVIARRGYCSRREAEAMIAANQVYVDQVLISSPATKIPLDAHITISGKPIATVEPTKIWAFYKPKDCITTHKDPQGRTTLFSLLPPSMARVISVGRLDYSTEGLILLCNNGEITRQLELPSSKIPRIYRCKVYGRIPSAMVNMLSSGVEIDGVRYASIRCTVQNAEDRQHWLEMKLTEGKNREIRRICEYFGLQVSRLIRTQYGTVYLDDMHPGEIIALSAAQVSQLLGMTTKN